MKCQAWCKRDKKRIETELEQKEPATKKKTSWALYRECEILIKKNNYSWYEGQETEKLRRLEEEEKSARLTETGNKKKSSPRKQQHPRRRLRWKLPEGLKRRRNWKKN
jgi:hypothetical protein